MCCDSDDILCFYSMHFSFLLLLNFRQCFLACIDTFSGNCSLSLHTSWCSAASLLSHSLCRDCEPCKMAEPIEMMYGVWTLFKGSSFSTPNLDHCWCSQPYSLALEDHVFGPIYLKTKQHRFFLHCAAYSVSEWMYELLSEQGWERPTFLPVVQHRPQNPNPWKSFSNFTLMPGIPWCTVRFNRQSIVLRNRSGAIRQLCLTPLHTAN